MHPRTEELLTYLDEQRTALRRVVDSIPPERRDEAPGSEQWSPAAVLEHLAIVETSIIGLIKDRVIAARTAGIGEERETSSVLETFLARSVVLDRTRRITASPASHPTRALGWDAAWQALETARANLRQVILDADGLALGEITHPHRVFGPLNLYHWIAFIGGHEARHTAQILETANGLNRQTAPTSE